MSQIKFKTPSGHMVMAGWDNPLQGYFLSVFNPESDDDDAPECAYSSLDDPDAKPMGFMADTKYFEKELRLIGLQFDFVVPPGFWERVDRKEGNVTHIFKGGEWSQG